MNKKQRFIGVVVAVLLALAAFFPPWVYSNGRQIIWEGFSYILWPPGSANQIDLSRLFAEALLILALGGASWLWAGRDTPRVKPVEIKNEEPPPARASAPAMPQTPPMPIMGRDGASKSFQQTAPPASTPTQRKPFWPTSRKQWLLVAGLGVITAGPVLITVLMNQENSGEASKSRTPLNVDEFGGMIVNDVDLVKSYRNAADQGDANGEALLGDCYLNGKGVIKDYVEAAKYFGRAADQGNGFAQADLGYCYINGFGVPQDFVQAYLWSNLAAAQGQATAATNLAFLDDHMTPEQIAEAQRLSHEFKPRHKPDLLDRVAETWNKEHQQPKASPQGAMSQPALPKVLSDADVGIVPLHPTNAQPHK
jgi:hypothetical protein